MSQPPGRYGRSRAATVFWRRLVVFPVPLVAFLVTGILTVVTYGEILHGFFILDDFAWLSCAQQALRDPGRMLGLEINGLFRPVAHLAFSVLFAAARLEPWPYHAAAFLLHMLAAALLGTIAWHLARERVAGLLAAAFFALLPVHSEALLWISALSEPLGAVLLLICLRAWLSVTRSAGLDESETNDANASANSNIKINIDIDIDGEGSRGLKIGAPPGFRSSPRRPPPQPRGTTKARAEPFPRGWLALALISFVLALGAKESAVLSLPLMLLLHAGLRAQGRARPLRLGLYLPFVALLLVYLALQWRLQREGFLVTTGQYQLKADAVDRMARALYWLLQQGWPPLVAAALAAATRTVRWRRDHASRRSSRRPRVPVVPALLAAAAVVLALAPYAPFTGSAALAGRYYYLAAAAFSVAVALALAPWLGTRGPALLGTAFTLLAVTGMTASCLLSARASLERARRASLRTEKFVRESARLEAPPPGAPPLLIVNKVLSAPHLRAALELFHPRGARSFAGAEPGLQHSLQRLQSCRHGPASVIWDERRGTFAALPRAPAPPAAGTPAPR